MKRTELGNFASICCNPSLVKPSRNIGVEIPAHLTNPPDEIVYNPAISGSLRGSA
jgi:hypothetical protein